MPRGSKDKYTAEQKRKAEHIEKVTRKKVCPKTKPRPEPGRQ